MKDNEFAVYFRDGNWRISRRKKFLWFEYWSKVGFHGAYDTWYNFSTREDCLRHIQKILRAEEKEKNLSQKTDFPTYEDIMGVGSNPPRPEPPRGPR